MFRFNDFFKNKATLIIAEFANAFEGKKEIALKMIDKADESGVDALKFQIFFADELLVPEHPKYEIFKQLESSRDDWKEILDYASKTNKLIFIDVFGEQSFEFSKNFKVDAYKISPTDMTNERLINLVSASGISTILSAGASTMDEIRNAVNICRKNALNDYAIMHGFQSYPTKLDDTNLNLIKAIEGEFNCPVGYADHVDGGSEMALFMPLLAVSKGAKIIEKHFTLNRDLMATDYQSSVNPDVLKKIVQFTRDVELTFGKSEKKLSSDEWNYKKDIRKRLVTKREMIAGEKISEQDLIFKRAPTGVFAEELEKVVGRTVIKKIEKNHVLELKHII